MTECVTLNKMTPFLFESISLKCFQISNTTKLKQGLAFYSLFAMVSS